MVQQKHQADPYVQLARKTIEEYIRTGSIIELPKDLPQEMYETQAGVFVSIKIKDRRQGCAAVSGRLQPFSLALQKRSFKTRSVHRP